MKALCWFWFNKKIGLYFWRRVYMTYYLVDIRIWLNTSGHLTNIATLSRYQVATRMCKMMCTRTCIMESQTSKNSPVCSTVCLWKHQSSDFMRDGYLCHIMRGLFTFAKVIHDQILIISHKICEGDLLPYTKYRYWWLGFRLTCFLYGLIVESRAPSVINFVW